MTWASQDDMTSTRIVSQCGMSINGSSGEFNIIVLGYGVAGAAAALSALQHGAHSVLIVEKAERGGGNSFVSAGNMVFLKSYTPETRYNLLSYLHTVTANTTPRTVLKTFVDELEALQDWLGTLGAEWKDNRTARMTFPGLTESQRVADAVVARHVPRTETCTAASGGGRVWTLLDKALVSDERVTLVTGVATVSLLQEGGLGGKVCGLELADGRQFFATGGVILACGGFQNSDSHKRDFFGPRRIGILGDPHNTGDGIPLVQAAGGQLWHMTDEASVLGFWPDGWKTGFSLALPHPGFIFVDGKGDRFINETALEGVRGHTDTAVQDLHNGGYAHDPMFCLMDDENVQKATVVSDRYSYACIREGYVWSDGSKYELSKGWIKRFNSLPEVAKEIGCPVDALTRTVHGYNLFTQLGMDTQFGRAEDTLKKLKAPYFLMRIQPLLYNTQGGPRRTVKCEVVTIKGALRGEPGLGMGHNLEEEKEEVVEGLYAAGEFGSAWGYGYQSSMNFSEACITGRISGRECALRLKTSDQIRAGED